MGHQTHDAIGTNNLTVLADRGYFKSEEIFACEQTGIKTLVPKSLTSNNKAAGLFDKADFRYIRAKDEYRCPAGQHAIWRFTTVEHGLTLRKYWSSACPRCPIKGQCTTGDYRRIARWEHEKVIDAMQKRLDRTPQAPRIRRRTVEHPFGTLKAWMGATHFLTRTLPRVSTEMSMLDVHAPHQSIHTWRDFFIHIAAISIGLLIAIGLGQTVEYLHHRHQVADLREALRIEREQNHSRLADQTTEFRTRVPIL